MTWIFFALLTIIFYAGFDFFLKLSSGRISEGWGGFVINFASAIVLLLYIFILRNKENTIFSTKPYGLLFSIIAGLFIGLATITFIRMYASGVNLSIGSPIVRIGTVLVASLLGMILLKEPFSIRYLVGFMLALTGLYLLISK